MSTRTDSGEATIGGIENCMENHPRLLSIVKVNWQDTNITQRVRLVITWKRDPLTNRKPFCIEGR